MRTGVKSIRALARGLEVFKAVVKRRDASLQQLYEDTGLAKPTLLRMLKTLEEGGLARRSLGDNRYRVSSGARLFFLPPSDADLIAERAAPLMDALCREVLWPSDLGVYSDGAIQIIESSRYQTPFPVNRHLMGYTVHVLMSAMGRAHLAFSPPAVVREIIERLRQSDDPYDWGARDPAKIMRSLAAIRSAGYAVREPGYGGWVRPGQGDAIAVPVLQGRRVLACLSLSWPADAATVKQIVSRHLGQLKATAAEIAAKVAAERDVGS
ncbi:MAG: helix-turn-helix domain-containing protein [Alphaproteobacteria bacterium]|nr:helix-turn-helix domain-containing protein [Alphaproteobacteria bacterium]